MPDIRKLHRYSVLKSVMKFGKLLKRASLSERGCDRIILNYVHLNLQGSAASYLVELEHLLFLV